MAGFSHFDGGGKAVMVDVGGKPVTARVAVATGRITMSRECLDAVLAGGCGKGDVLGAARLAGIMAAKQTSGLIPLCHNIPIEKAAVELDASEQDCVITATCTVKTTGVTGVEMEALTGVSVALLTVYDMCKALDKSMVISDIHLAEKTGGKGGPYRFGQERA